MKKIILPLLLALMIASCSKKDSVQDETLATLIKNKDVKGLQKYRENQKLKMDSMTKVMGTIDDNLQGLGVNQTEAFVSVEKLEQQVFIHFVELQGNVTTDQDVTVTPQFSGLLTLYVKEGQRVSKGQVLGRVADGGLTDQYKQAQIQVTTVKAQLAQTEAQANLTKIAFQKQSALWNQKIGSEFQYLQAKTNFEAAQKQVSAMKSTVAATQSAANAVNANLAKTKIIAPFSGVVDKIFTQTGQGVASAPATDILKLISLGIMRVEAKVPETYLANVKPGTNVEIFFPTLNKTINSRIRLIGNYIDPATRTFTVQIPVANEGGNIKPNLLAQLKIEDYTNPSAIAVSGQYIYKDAAQKNYVFVAEKINGKTGIAKKVIVESGQKSADKVEITSGLKSGDIIITDGSKSLSDGQQIKLQ